MSLYKNTLYIYEMLSLHKKIFLKFEIWGHFKFSH